MNVAEVYTTETANIANNLWVNDLQVNSWFALTARKPLQIPSPTVCQPLKFCIYFDFYSDLTLMYCTFFGCAHANSPHIKPCQLVFLCSIGIILSCTIFRLTSRHSMWRAGRATWTLWSVCSEQMQMSIFREM